MNYIREKCDYLRRTSRSNWSVGNNETVTGKRRKSVRRVASRPGKSDGLIQNSRQNYIVNPIGCLCERKKMKDIVKYISYLYFRENNLAF